MEPTQAPLIKSSALQLFVAAAILCATGQGLAAEPAGYAAANSSDKKSAAPSAGLVNDWLRDKSEVAKDWDLGGQIRTRYEIKDNAGVFANRDFIRNGQVNDNHALELRMKIHLGYSPADWVNFFVEGRDARSWWETREPSPSDDSFDLHQAFIRLGNSKDFPLILTAGRQELTYGDERFIGIADWSNTGRSFDAVKLRYEVESFWVDGFVSRVVVPYDEHFNRDNDYDTFSGIYASTKKLIPWQETQVFVLARDVGGNAPNASATGVPGSPTTARDIYTIGGRLKSLPGKLHGWDYSTEVAGQFGSVSQSGVRRDLHAMAADTTVGYTWAKVWGSPRLGAGYFFASGDSNFTDGKTETFEPLFGTNHKLYGYMDLFGLRNVHNPSISASLKPLKSLSLRLDYLGFWLADDHDLLYPESGSGRTGNGYGRNPQFNSFIGSELDFLVNYQAASWLELQAGYGHFFTGKYIKQSVGSVAANGGAVDADWVYLQVKLSF